jgi:hypothetical protein
MTSTARNEHREADHACGLAFSLMSLLSPQFLAFANKEQCPEACQRILRHYIENIVACVLVRNPIIMILMARICPRLLDLYLIVAHPVRAMGRRTADRCLSWLKRRTI